MDLCEAYRKFSKDFFPHASIVADKFHVLRLLHTDLNRERKRTSGHLKKATIGRALLKNGSKLPYEDKLEIKRYLDFHPKLQALYEAKEALSRLYRIKRFDQAKRTFIFMCDEMSRSPYPEIRRLRKTLIRWQKEILNDWSYRVTNARAEGFNSKAKLTIKRAYGVRTFNNYRLRVLDACS